MDDEKVVPLRVVEIGAGVKIGCDQILEKYKGRLTEIVVIGVRDGQIMCASSEGSDRALWLVEKAKKEILV